MSDAYRDAYRKWEDTKNLAWMELRHAAFALSGKGNSNLINDHAYADAKLSNCAMEYARIMCARPKEIDNG